MDEQKKLYFSSSYTIGKKEYYDYCQIMYRRTVKELTVIAVLSILIGVVLPILAGSFEAITAISSAVLFLCAFLGHLLPGACIQRNYTQMLLRTGKDHIPYTTKFGEKIVMKSELDQTREYDYSEITHIRQTSGFYLLHVGLGLHIIVAKNVVSHIDSLEFIPFLMAKCKNLKKKKVIDYTYSKAKALGSLAVIGIIALVDLLMMVL